MKTANFWLRILNVYPSEWWIVKRLYLLQFFQGAGIAFLFTSAFAQFLDRFPITRLPWVMVCSALLLWLTGIIYTRLEHALKFERFNIIVIVFMAGSMLIVWVANFSVKNDWFFYLMMAWFNVLYMLNNMQFWGIASLLFDLRQSKRLFAVISSGDIPAKFIGYTLALIVVPYTGTKNLLLMGAVCIVASVPFFLSIVRSGKLVLHHPADHGKKAHEPTKLIRKLVTNIASNTYIRDIAFISLITSACILLINYGFYGEVKKAYHDDVALASFIAFFYASLRIIAFVVKMVFSSRVTASLGIKPALFITPVVMLILVTSIVAVDSLSQNQKPIFYLFGVCSIIVEVLRTSFSSPVLITLMQPLPTHERLRAHNIVKGIMDPFASFFSGIFLLLLLHFYNRVNLMFLCYALFILGVLWIGGVFGVNRKYLSILMKTIGSRYFSRDEFNLSDEAVREQVSNKMMTGTELEVISILAMLDSKKIDPVAEGLIIQLLQHPSDQVKTEALRLINRNFADVKQRLETLLTGEENEVVKKEAVKTFCKIGENTWRITAWLEDPREEMRSAAITGMLGNNDINIKENARTFITQLLLSSHKEDKRKALVILNDVKDLYGHPDHAYLVGDTDIHIRDLAISAIGKAALNETLRALPSHMPTREKLVMKAFLNAGVNSIPVLNDHINSVGLPYDLKEKLIILCGKIGGDASKFVLIDLLKKMPMHTDVIVRALHRCKYTVNAASQKEFESIARAYIIYGVELLHMQQALSKKNSNYDLLNNALQYEIQNIGEISLNLFGCMYDREKMNQVKHALNESRKESIANAMEIIELTVKKDIGRQFNTIFETTTIEQRCTHLRTLFTVNQFNKIEHVLERILSEKPIEYFNWTKACSLYISKKYVHPLNAVYYDKYVHSENILLRETAQFASTIN